VTKEEITQLSDREKAVVQNAADVMGLSFEDAATELFSKGLARRSKKRTGHKPSSVKALRRPK